MQIPDSLEPAFRAAGRALVATHISPDGDAVGSAAALAHIAVSLGAETRIFLPEPLPTALSPLALPAPVVKSLADCDGWAPDLVITADCGAAKRAGPDMAALLARERFPAPAWREARSVNIDHHHGNPAFADINWVEPERAATGELVGAFAESLGLPLTGGLGEALYLALVTDTGNFTYANTTADCLRLAARIVAAGLDVADFTERYENVWSIKRMHLWGRLLSELSVHENGAVVACVVPRRYLDDLGLDNGDLEGFASWMRRLRGARASLFVREDGPGNSKISLRSMGDVDVRAVAALFGGGGHTAAAGAEIALPPEEAAGVVLEALKKHL